MRIIGGEWRGRKDRGARGRDVTRPTRLIACARRAHLWSCRHSISIWTRFVCWTPLAAPVP